MRFLVFVLGSGFSTSDSDDKVDSVVTIDSGRETDADNEDPRFVGCFQHTARLLLTFFFGGGGIMYVCG